jgi:hypothetical protein
MRLSYNAAWDDAAALLRAHGSLLAALAGVFLFLPTLVLREVAPPPLMTANLAETVALFQAYVEASWPLLLASRLVELVGSVAILQLLLGPRGTSVGGAIVAGGMLVPFYFVASVLGSFAIGIGLMLLLVPGLYLIGRLALLPAVVVAERRRNPVDALRRTALLTAGHGWAILALIVLVTVATWVVAVVGGSAVGIVFALLAGKAVATFAAAACAAGAGAAGEVVLLAFYAALYRALMAQPSARVAD